MKLQAETDQRLARFLVSLGLVGERDLARVLAEALGTDVVPSYAYDDLRRLEGLLAADFLRNAIREHADHVVVAMGDPSDTYTVDALRLALGRPVVAPVGVISEIEAAIERQYGEGPVSLSQVAEDAGGVKDRDLEDVRQLRELASEAAVIRMVNLVIARALETAASDIHVEPYAGRLSVRYRIDGLLRDVDAPPRSAAAIISRIKVMANLSIAERRLPQDGRIRMRVAGREVDMRVSTVPTMHGESIVMRLLDKESVALDFDVLGFRGPTLEALRRLLSRPQGILLVTGPTGSGKTTTRHQHRLDTPHRTRGSDHTPRGAGSKRRASRYRGVPAEDEESEDFQFVVERREVEDCQASAVSPASGATSSTLTVRIVARAVLQVFVQRLRHCPPPTQPLPLNGLYPEVPAAVSLTSHRNPSRMKTSLFSSTI